MLLYLRSNIIQKVNLEYHISGSDAFLVSCCGLDHGQQTVEDGEFARQLRPQPSLLRVVVGRIILRGILESLLGFATGRIHEVWMVDQLLQRGDGGQAAGGHLAAVLGPQRAADGVRVAEGRIDVVLELSQLAHQHLLHLDRQVLGQQRLCSSDNTSKQDRMLNILIFGKY